MLYVTRLLKGINTLQYTILFLVTSVVLAAITANNVYMLPQYFANN